MFQRFYLKVVHKDIRSQMGKKAIKDLMLTQGNLAQIWAFRLFKAPIAQSVL